MTNQTGPARRQLILVSALFLVPLLFAALMYFGDLSWQPAGRINHGELLTPITNLNEVSEQQFLSDLSDGATDDHWLLIYVDIGGCDESCREALYRLHQSRLMLGNEMSRLKRVFLHGTTTPDTVLPDEEHRGLIIIADTDLGNFLLEKRPQHLPGGGLYLVDPLGNLVMYFPAELTPGDMVADIKHLLGL